MERIETTLQDAINTSRSKALKLLGKFFKVKLRMPEYKEEADVGAEMIERFLLPHLPKNDDKYNTLMYVDMRKINILVL